MKNFLFFFLFRLLIKIHIYLLCQQKETSRFVYFDRIISKVKQIPRIK